MVTIRILYTPEDTIVQLLDEDTLLLWRDIFNRLEDRIRRPGSENTTDQ